MTDKSQETQPKETPVQTQAVFTIAGKDYTEDMLTTEQLLMIRHLVSINQKLQELSFNAQQLQVTQQAFSAQLEVSLKQTEAALQTSQEKQAED